MFTHHWFVRCAAVVLASIAGATTSSSAQAQQSFVPVFNRTVNELVCALHPEEAAALGTPSATHGAFLGVLKPRNRDANYAVGDTITRDSILSSVRSGNVIDVFNAENANISYAGAAFTRFTTARINAVDRQSDLRLVRPFFFAFDGRNVVFNGTSTFNGGQAINGGTTRYCNLFPTDDDKPHVTLSNAPESIEDLSPFVVDVTFDEDVTGFDDPAVDVMVDNGHAVGITGSVRRFQVTIMPSGDGDVSISVPADSAMDDASNGNLASAVFRVSAAATAETQAAVSNYMLDRANLLASSQPGLIHLLQGGGCGQTGLSISSAGGFIQGCGQRGGIWGDLTSRWTDHSSYTLGTIGSHLLVQPNLVAGVMLQFDSMSDESTDITGTGWMVGPYVVAQAPNQPLFLEARLLYGQTSNETGAGDAFDTTRLLGQVRAAGELEFGDLTLMPLLDVTFVEDAQAAFSDGMSNDLPEQKVSLTQITAGLDFSRSFDVPSGSVKILGGLNGVLSTTDADSDTVALPEFDGARARVELGFDYAIMDGPVIRASTFYDGIGSDFAAQGINVNVNFRF